MIRNHQRAVRAHSDVHCVADEVKESGNDELRIAYGSICHKLPILVHNEGLAVALHFVAARNKEKQRLLAHLSEPTTDALLRSVRDANLSETQSLTREAQRCLDWYKRFAKTILKTDGSEDGEDDGGEP